MDSGFSYDSSGTLYIDSRQMRTYSSQRSYFLEMVESG